MPGGKRYHKGKRVRGFSGSGLSIGTAWKKKTRKKTSLLARTAKSNYKQIKVLKGRVEQKMIQSVACTLANEFGGQYIRATSVDSSGFAAGLAGTPNLIIRPWSGMGNGNLQSQRVGSEIHMTSLTYRIQFEPALAETNRMGCLIVLDRSPGGVQPALTGPAAPNPAAAGVILNGPGTTQYLRFQNLDTCSGGDEARFKVLKHIKVAVQATTAGADWPPQAVRSGTLKLPYKIRYDAVAGSIDPVNQQLLFCFYSDSTVAPHPTIEMYSRFRYKDA